MKFKKYSTAAMAVLITGLVHGETTVSGDSASIVVDTDVKEVRHIELTGPNNLSERSTAFEFEPEEAMVDGRYTVYVYASYGMADIASDQQNNGRPPGTKQGEIIKIAESVSFRLVNGEIVYPQATVEK